VPPQTIFCTSQSCKGGDFDKCARSARKISATVHHSACCHVSIKDAHNTYICSWKKPSRSEREACAPKLSASVSAAWRNGCGSRWEVAWECLATRFMATFPLHRGGLVEVRSYGFPFLSTYTSLRVARRLGKQYPRRWLRSLPGCSGHEKGTLRSWFRPPSRRQILPPSPGV
jgi:hypothetical protein